MAGNASMAIISADDGTQRAYRVGDSVRSGLVLDEIGRNHVVLVAGNVRHGLLLTSEVVAPAVADQRLLAAPEPTSVVSAGAPRGRWGAFVRNPGGGLRVESVKPNGPFTSLEFKEGDVLWRLDGAPLDSPRQLGMLLHRLKGGGQAEVDLLREGHPETLRFGQRSPKESAFQ